MEEHEICRNNHNMFKHLEDSDAYQLVVYTDNTYRENGVMQADEILYCPHCGKKLSEESNIQKLNINY